MDEIEDVIVEDSVDKAANALEVIAKENQEIKAKMDEVLLASANLNKAFIRTNEEEKEVGDRGYSFTDAAKDYALGKNAKAPYWDAKTTASFNDYCSMLAKKDVDGIKKAFGDATTNAANWTPTEFVSELVRLAFVSSVMLPKVTIKPMSRDKMSMPAPTGDFTWGFVDAGSAMVDSAVTAGILTLETAKAYGLALVNQEDLDDPAYPLASYIVAKLAEDYAKFVDGVILYGDASGSGTVNGEFDGWAEATSVNAVTGAVDASPAFGDLITLAKLNEMVATLDEQEIEGAEFIMSMPAYNAVRNLKDSNTDPLVSIVSPYDISLMGFPMTKTGRALSTATALKVAVFFGNPKHIIFGDRMNMSVATSEHYRFANDQVVFRAMSRFAVKVAIPSALVKLSFGATTS